MSTTNSDRRLDRKLHREVLLGRYVANPMMRGLFKVGLTPPLHTLVETTGRKSGATRRVPVAYGRDGDTVWLISQHGDKSGWARNVLADPQVRLLIGKAWVSGRAQLVPDDDVRARLRSFATNKLSQRLLRASFQALETRPMSVRVTLT